MKPYTIDDYFALAELAQNLLADEFDLHGLSEHTPKVTPGMMRAMLEAVHAYGDGKPAEPAIFQNGDGPAEIPAPPIPEPEEIGLWGGRLAPYLSRPLTLYTDGIYRLETGELTWRTTAADVRREIVNAYIRWLAWRYEANSPSAALFDDNRPDWMSKAGSLALGFGVKWSELVEAALQQEGLYEENVWEDEDASYAEVDVAQESRF